MKHLWIIPILALATQFAWSQEPAARGEARRGDGGADRAEAPSPIVAVAPVLKPTETPETRVLVLPGPKTAKPRPQSAARPAQRPAAAVAKPAVAASQLPPGAPVIPPQPTVDLAPPAEDLWTAAPSTPVAPAQPGEPAVDRPAIVTVPALWSSPPADAPASVPALPAEPSVPAIPPVPAIEVATPAPAPVVPADPDVEKPAPVTVPAVQPSPAGDAALPASELSTTAPPQSDAPVPDPAVPPAPVPPAPKATVAPYPADLEADSALALQKQIGHWTLDDARSLLGDPRRERAAMDDNQTENGRIYAFQDPSGRFKELELDFDGASGNLRTVFVYPWNLTWQDCRRLFGANVSATQANKGRTFYSYVNRRLDVLVEPGGQVVSLGLY